MRKIYPPPPYLVCFWVAVLSLFAASCQRSEPPAEEPLLHHSQVEVLVPARGPNVSLSDFLGTTTKLSKSSNKEVLNVVAITDSANDTLMYAVNYTENNGFVVFSATRNYRPIIVEAESGVYAEPIENPGLRLMIDHQKEVIKQQKHHPDSSTLQAYHLAWLKYAARAPLPASKSDGAVVQLRHQSISQWQSEGFEVMTVGQVMESYLFSESEKSEIDLLTYRYASRAYDRMMFAFVLIRDRYTTETKGPLLSTAWHQGTPFNNNMAIYSGVERYAAGCVNIAVGQIMKYHQYPTSFNWTAIDGSAANSVTAAFISNLYVATQSYSLPNNRSTYSNLPQALMALVSYGYRATEYPYTSPRIMGNLRSNRPVYLQGDDGTDGHAWVCDGFKENQNTYTFMVKGLEDSPYTPTQYLTLREHQTNAILSRLLNMNYGHSNAVTWTTVEEGYYPRNVRLMGDIYPN